LRSNILYSFYSKNFSFVIMKYTAHLSSNMNGKLHKTKLSDDASVCSTATMNSSHPSLDVSLSSESGRTIRGVTFKRRVAKIIVVDFVCDIDDVEDHWYTSDDFQVFRARDKKLLAAMRSAVTVEDLEEKMGECTRGLEREKTEMKRRSHAHKRDCWAVVLSQLDHVENADAIAKAYGRSTRASTRDAIIIARLDAMAAKEYAYEDSYMESSFSKAILPSPLLERTYS
jgi:hypothetical protein